MDLNTRTITELKEALEAGDISSEEVVASSLERIEKQNADLNAVLGTAEHALEQAREIDKKRANGDNLGRLAGIPVILKDNILHKDWKTTAASQMLENYTAPYDATVVKRLKQAGAILIGRANMDEFAMGSSTETSHFGTTKNPWNTEMVPGGSSGGSAAAVAAGMAPAALGSDTGGSIRQPAAMCGVTGLKPTYGRVSRYGLMAMASSLDQIGPMTRTVRDAALIMEEIEGPDEQDATSVSLPDTSIPELVDAQIDGLKVGVPKEYFVDGMDDSVKRVVEEAIGVLEEGGAEVQEISLPHTEYALATYYIIMPAEVSSNLGRYDGMRYGYNSDAETLERSYKRTRGEAFGDEVQRRIMLGTYTLSSGYYDAYYRKALQVRTLIQQDFTEAFKDVDIIVGPTSPSVAWPVGEKFNDPLTMYLSDIYTISANLATVPALSVPCGFTNGLPVGLQMMAKPFDESMLYRAGVYYQSVTDWHEQHPNETHD